MNEAYDFVCLFWQNDTTYFGNIVGRVANRIGGAKFGINGVFYKLIPNDGRNLLHGMFDPNYNLILQKWIHLFHS